MNNPSYRVPGIFAQLAGLVAAESTRHGGVSREAYSSQNLGINTNDDPTHIAENRRQFLANWHLTEAELASSYQVHGTAVRVAMQGERTHGFDAIITNKPGLLVGVTVADCTPILVYDSQNKVVAAIHAGWRGTAGGIVAETLRLMQAEFGTNPVHCLAYVGTCIDECDFEVSADVAAQFSPEHQRPGPVDGKFFVDLKKANVHQLQAAGVPASQIETSPFSTVAHNADYFSHRLEQGVTGRMLAVIGIL